MSSNHLEKPGVASEEGSGTRIGRYKLLEEIGEGAFGRVFMAEQTDPVNRKVALKVVKAGMDTREVIARFEAERQALALMDHPNIAKVLDAGTTETGRPYFVMELVRGQPITAYCDQHQLSTLARLQLFMKVCAAVQHAHQKGIIHRDLKPTNILVTVIDGEPVPKVIDFGVAKALGQKLTEKTLFTSFHHMIGTPAYMSPEQAEFSGVDVDTRSDIYSLGVLLYELLTGVTPLDAETLRKAGVDEVRRLIRETEPPKPSTRLVTLGPKLTEVAERRQTDPSNLPHLLHGDLDWIVMRALEKDRARRYDTTSALAQDIDNYLHQLPVTAAAPTLGYRFKKFACRNRTALITASAFVLLLIVGSIISIGQAVRANRNAAIAEEHAARASDLAQRANDSEKESRTRLVSLNLANGNRMLDEGNRFAALNWYAEALRLDSERPDKQAIHQLRLSSVIKQSPKLLHMWFHAGGVNSANLSKDGRLAVTAGADQTARIWDVNSGLSVLPPLLHTNPVLIAVFSPDGRWVLTATAQSAQLWNLATGEAQLRLDHEGLEDARFSPDGLLIATASGNGTIKVWDAATGRLKLPVLQHRLGPRISTHNAVLDFSTDGRYLLTAAYDKVVKVWDVKTGVLQFTLQHNSYTRYARFSPDGKLIATANWAATAHLWDATTGRPLGPPLAHGAMVDHVEFSPDGKWMISSSLDGTARMWDTAKGGLVRTYGDGRDFVFSATFSRDGTQILLCHFSGLVQTWSAADFTPVSAQFLHGVRAVDAQFHPDGRRVFMAYLDGSVRLWDLRPQGMSSWPWRQQPLAIIQVAPSGTHLVTENDSGQLQVWNTLTWQSLAVLGPFSNGISQAFFTRDERHLLTIELEQVEEKAKGPTESRFVFNLWDLANGARLHSSRAPSIFSRPGRFLFAASPDCRRLAWWAEGIVQAWDVASGSELWRTTPHKVHPTLRVLCYSPDGRQVAFNCDKKIHLLNAANGQEIFPLTNKLLVSGIEYASDGQRLVGTYSDLSLEGGEACLWDAAAGKLLSVLKHTDGVNCAAFSADGRLLATGGNAMAARIFDTRNGHPISPAMRMDNHIFTIAFSPDGRMLATGDDRNTIRLWDTSTGEPIVPPIVCSNKVTRIVFLAQNRYLAIQHYDYWHLWDLRSDQFAREDLFDFVGLLSGHRLDSTGVLQPFEAAVLSNRWTHLSSQFPEAFAFFPKNVLRIPDGRLKPPLLIRPRDATASQGMLDLSKFYNVSFNEDTFALAGNNLAGVPLGIQKLQQTHFDIRGVIQLCYKDYLWHREHSYPVFVSGIPVNRKCTAIHFLQGTMKDEASGMKIGAYVLHYSDGQKVELPIVFGVDVRSSWFVPGEEEPEPTRSRLAWTGENATVKKSNTHLRLYQKTWKNSSPDREIKSIDFISSKTLSAPFLIAITVE